MHYLIGQIISFNIIGIIMIMIIFSCGITVQIFQKSEHWISATDFKICFVSILYFYQLTFFSIFVSYFYKNPQIAKESLTLIYYLILYYSCYTVATDKNQIFRILSPHTEFVEFGFSVIGMTNKSLILVFFKILCYSFVYFVMTIYCEVVFGENDDLIPNKYLHKTLNTNQIAEIGKEISNAKIVMIPKAGHLVMFEQAASFNEAILSFK